MLPDYVGKRIGNYQVTGVLGRGGMGVVLRAFHVVKQREVALKLMLGGAYQTEQARQRFIAEAQAMAQLEHPGLVGLFGVGKHEDTIYFAMELVTGAPLSQVIDKLPPLNLANIAAQVTDALQYVHESGYIHRDVKPANILLNPEGRAQLMDFGVAKDTSRGQMTMAGTAIGTPAFMAPELASGEDQRIDHRVDIYALGAVLYRGLAGRLPYEGDNPLNVITKVIKGPPPRPSELVPGVDADLERICLKAMAREPEDRYPMALDLLDDLTAYQSGAPVTDSGVQRLSAQAAQEAAQGVAAAVTMPPPDRINLQAPQGSNGGAVPGTASARRRAPQSSSKNRRLSASGRNPARAASSGRLRPDRGNHLDGEEPSGFPLPLVVAVAVATLLLAGAMGVLLSGSPEPDPAEDEVVEVSATEEPPRPDDSATDPTPDDSATDPTPDDSATDPTPDDSATDPPQGDAPTDPPQGGTPSPDDAPADPAPDTTPAEPPPSPVDEREAEDPEVDDGTEPPTAPPEPDEGTPAEPAPPEATAPPAPTDDPKRARALFAQGVALFKRGDLGAARDVFDQAIALNDHDAEAYNSRAATRARLGDINGAKADLDRALELDPRLAGAWLNRAFVNHRIKNWQGAHDDAERFLKFGSNPEALALRGLMCARLGHKGAKKNLEAFLEKYPNHPNQALVNDVRGALRKYDRAPPPPTQPEAAPFADAPRPNANVREVRIWIAKGLGLQCAWGRRLTKVEGTLHGAAAGPPDHVVRLKIRQKEFLVAVEGRGDASGIASITLHTTKTTYGPFDRAGVDASKLQAFRLEAKPKQKIVGFKGAGGPGGIVSLGAVTR